MTEQEIKNLLLIGKFMDIKYLFPYQSRGDSSPLGVYIADDEDSLVDYKNGINWYEPDTDYNQLMNIVEKIESLDLREYFYQWEYPEGWTQYNFNGIVVDIRGNQCIIYMENTLDPIDSISDHRCETKKEAIYLAIIDFVKWYNDLILNNNE